MTQILTVAIELIFAALFAVAVARYRRDHSVISLDLVLIFGSFAWLLVQEIVKDVGGALPTPITQVATLFLLAQPIFALHLAGQFVTLKRFALPAAIVGFVATSGPLIALGTSAPKWLGLAAVAVFMGIDLTAAIIIGLSARGRRGPAAVRRQIVACSTAIMGFALLVAGVASSSGGAGGATLIAPSLVLISGLGFLVALLPPKRLQRIWHASAAFPELRDFLLLADDTQIWDSLVSGARRMTGAPIALVAESGDAGWRVLAASGIDPAATAPILERFPTDGSERATNWAEGATGGAFAYGMTVPLAGRSEDTGPAAGTPRLVVVSDRPPLFPEDDRLLLEVLGGQALTLAQRASLAVEQDRLAEELHKSVEALEQASKAKSAFLASMSHELRTPLNAIIGFADLMRDELADDGKLHVAPEWAEHIHAGGGHLLEIINDILDLSKVESGRFELDCSTFALGDAITESLAAMRPLAEKKGQTLDLSIPEGFALVADRGRFRQILYNLLSNAVKYTPDGGSIRVDVVELADTVELSVTDTGIGIDPDNVQRIFEEFWQAGEPGHTNGTGLGLAVTRRLVEAHGGSIRVESTRASGSRFTVSLPNVSGTEADRTVSVPTPSSRRLTDRPGAPGDLLIVEDDPSTVRLLRAYLEPHGFTVRVATNGVDALRMAKQQRPGAILLDVILPGIDGWEVMRQLKADPELADIPVVFESAVDERTVGMALGAVDYILKPIDRELLLRTIGRILAGRRRVTSEPARILAIDDEPAALDIIDAALASSGHNLIRAGGGAEGISLAGRHMPDVIVCDLLMPDIDGFGVVDALRADPRTASIPILIVTGHDLSNAERQDLMQKVAGIIAKASGPHDLRRWLEDILARDAA